MTPAELRDLLDDLDRLGILTEVKKVHYTRMVETGPVVIGFTTDTAWTTAIAAHKSKGTTRLVGGTRDPHRISDADCGTWIAEHYCWPWLDCWGTS